MSDKAGSSSGKISQETVAIFGMGVLILVSLFAGYNTLSSKIDNTGERLTWDHERGQRDIAPREARGCERAA